MDLAGGPESLRTYVEARLLHRITEAPTVDSHFRILGDVFFAALGPVLVAALVLLARGGKHPSCQGRRSRTGHAAHRFGRGVAADADPRAEIVLHGPCPSRSSRWPSPSSPHRPWHAPRQDPSGCSVIPRHQELRRGGPGRVALASVLLFGRPSRDADMLHDVDRIGALVPPARLIASEPGHWARWNLQCYLMRRHFISIDPEGRGHAWALSDLQAPGRQPALDGGRRRASRPSPVARAGAMK